MRKYVYSIISIFLSISCILIIVFINNKIADQYLASDGKTRVLFGMIELLSYSYKYYFIPISLISIAASIIGKRKQEGKRFFWISFTFSIISLILIFIPIWRIKI
jgi:hypothetical protein